MILEMHLHDEKRCDAHSDKARLVSVPSLWEKAIDTR